MIDILAGCVAGEEVGAHLKGVVGGDGENFGCDVCRGARGAETGMICVGFVASKKAAPFLVSSAASESAAALSETRQQLQEEVGQWVYFNRDLRLYDGTKTYLFKPMQRFHWTESQAMIDASEIIAETVANAGAAK